MTVSVSVADLSKSFAQVPALKAINTLFAGGQITGLVGPDGAGKTTLMRLLAGLMTPDTGAITVAGFDTVTQKIQVHEATGYMPQRFGLYEDLSVQENLRLYAALRELPEQQREATFTRLLKFTGLTPFTTRLASRLSGGMKQKLGLACALIARPQVLLLDEPSVGVDPLSRRELWKMVRELSGEGMVVVWSTAYLDEADNCDIVVLLDDGAIAYQGSPQKLSQRLDGRSYLASHVRGDRRQWLVRALETEGVRDGVIQGDSLRLVLSQAQPTSALKELVAAAGGELSAVAPRFEDAYIDLLGGGPGGHSEIAARMEPVADSRSTMVECKGLTKRFGEFVATDNVSFSVARGEILGLLGPNGAGKSTTFKMLCGLLKPSAGEALVAGIDLRRSSSAAKLKLGYMAQKFSLYGLLSVRQNLDFFSGIYGLRGRLRQQRIEEMIEVFELDPYLQSSPDVLPLGFKQRLALACALMHRPDILFLDEPTSGVDPITRREFWTHITGLVNNGVTVLVTTHFMDEAEYCDRVALVNQGQLIALDTPDALKASVATAALPEPTMEEAFIGLIETQNALLQTEALT
ncbi:ABC transporter ATP-binding protein [Halieaceae bacterium IMCC14734]|uniref:ABC transporter ATP-binding protein n=1 Tax=Candidatus Litorirhabdus singularis TaxID=2518993 RepID=A0ABT3TFH9_9GAMM|nr:ATP-binding cassette domain-containing protein [Candidatus Litorirhabdus singularis]MCX2981009.1 ABC transporter ATP-binding protein [Candidatus Litorirhabdus singularis]